MILMLTVAALLTTACGDSTSVLTPNKADHDAKPELDDKLAAACDHPSIYLDAGDWELIAGRIGDALIECGKEKRLLVDAYGKLIELHTYGR
tara:strand:- start:290 stop:565 length:276 start_codon:yes stop_codon:yes gene_type:complete